jgi:hypothetical protein
MHLYQGSTQQFIGDATQARLANQLTDRFYFMDAPTRDFFLSRTERATIRDMRAAEAVGPYEDTLSPSAEVQKGP